MPKYAINVNNKTYQIDSERELTEQEQNDLASDIQKQQTTQKIKDLPKTALNVGRKIGQGLSFGQGAHIEGANEAYGGAIYNLLHGENPFKDIKNDYLRGREQAKKDYKQFDEEHPVLSIGSEIVGSLPTGAGLTGALTKLGKIGKLASILNNKAVKSTTEGALYGGAYGLSNTEGEDLDLTNATKGALLGGGIGLGLSKAGNFLTKNRKNIQEIADSYKTASDKIANPKELLLNKQMTDEEIKQAVEKGKKIATVGEVAADENIPYYMLKTVDNWKSRALQGEQRANKLLNEISDKQFPFLNEQYKDNLIKDLSEVIPTIKNIGEEIYKPFNNATFVADDKAIISAINNIEDKAVRERATKALDKILNKPKQLVVQPTQPEIVNGWQILPKQTAPKQVTEATTMQELREARNELYDLAQEIVEIKDGKPTVNSSLGGQRAINYYDKLRKLLTEQAGNQIQGLKSADKLYSSMLNANSELVSILGKKLDKGNVLNKFLAELRNKSVPEASNMLNNVENKLNNVANQFKGTPYENQINQFKSLIENINDNSKLFQMSYALQPQEMIQTVGKRIDTKKVLKTILDEINSPQQKFYNFVKYAKAGDINKPARTSALDFGRTTVERKVAQNELFSRPKKTLFTTQEKQQIRKNLSNLSNPRIRNLINSGLLPKSTIRLLMQQFYK